MASIRVRNGRFQVRWRQDGCALAETFADRAQARRFQGLVIAAGERYPLGWVPGRGFVAASKAAASPGSAAGAAGTAGDGPTLAEWFERAVVARTTANDRSKQDMRRDFARHVPDWLADTSVDRITREQAGLWVNQLRTQPRGRTGRYADQPVSTKTIHNVHGHLSGAMNDAVRDGLAARNPFAGLLCGMPRTPAQEMVCLTPDEFVVLREAFIGHYQPFLTFLYATGLRFGEITALGPESFDLVHRTVRVEPAWKYDSVRHTYLGPPKTARAGTASGRVQGEIRSDLRRQIAVVPTSQHPVLRRPPPGLQRHRLKQHSRRSWHGMASPIRDTPIDRPESEKLVQARLEVGRIDALGRSADKAMDEGDAPGAAKFRIIS